MNEKELTIIQLNDSHGYLEEHFEHFYKGNKVIYKKVGGYSKIASYLKDVRTSKNNNVLFLDGGDTFHGTYPIIDTKGEILIKPLNLLGLDAMTAHWEFAYGPNKFKEILNSLNYPMLAINAYYKESNKLVFKPYIIKKINNIKIGIIGIAATIIDKVMPSNFSKGMYFTLGNEELPKYIKELKEDKGIDLIVVLSHLGFPQDVKLASEINGIDVLLSSHTHNRLYKPAKIKDTLIIQSGCHGSFLGHLDITLKNKKILSYNHKLVILNDSIKKDEAMDKLINKELKPYKDSLSTVIGTTKTNLDRSKVLESTMDNFLLNAIIDYTNADMAFSNGWRYGAPIPKGNITINDLWNIIPVNPPISKVKLKGKEVWDMLEENLERTFSTNPYCQMGGYVKRAMGINVYFKIENTFGQRIQQIFVGNEKIILDKLYDVAYVTSQGVPTKYGSNRRNLNIDAISVLKQYLKKYKVISAPIINTIVAI